MREPRAQPTAVSAERRPALARPHDTDRAARQSFRPIAVDPVGVLSCTSELSEALLLTVMTAVTAAAADVGLVHRVRADIGAAVTVGGKVSLPSNCSVSG